MYAVERLGSYITRGVYTVSGPFHPFGGAVDIIVVQQKDGSFKSSPWYVRFGKFQGVLKAKEKVVNISVNGVEANFHMYLDHKGEAFFLRDVDDEEEESIFYPSSSGEETDGQSCDRRPVKSYSYNYDGKVSSSVAQVDVNSGKIVARTGSRRSRILGLVFGRKSMKENRLQDEENGRVGRADSLERAEIAADLLDTNWSTNLASGGHGKDNTSQLSAPNISNGEPHSDLQINDGQRQVNSLTGDSLENSLDNPLSHEEIGPCNHEVSNSPPSGFQELESSVEQTNMEMPCLITDCVIGTSISTDESCLEENDELNSEMSRKINELGIMSVNHDENATFIDSENTLPDSSVSDSFELGAISCKKLDEDYIVDENVAFPCSGVSQKENMANDFQSFALPCSETLERSRVELNDSGEQAGETPCLSCRGSVAVCNHAETLHRTTELTSMVSSPPETDLLIERETLNGQEFLGDYKPSNSFKDAKILGNEGTSLGSIDSNILSASYTQTVTIDSINGSLKEVELRSSTISGFSNQISLVQDNKNIEEEGNASLVQHSSESVEDPVLMEAIDDSRSESSDEEQFVFSDLDDFQHGEVKCMKSISSNHDVKENHLSLAPRDIGATTVSLDSNFESHISPDEFVQQILPNSVEDLSQKSKMLSSHIDIPTTSKDDGREVGRMVESLPNMSFHSDYSDAQDVHHSHSLDSNSKSSKWMLVRKGFSSYLKSNAAKEHQLSQAQPTTEDAQISEELKSVPASTSFGETSEAIKASTGSWRLWPFPFKRSRSLRAAQPAPNCTTSSDVESLSRSTSGLDGEKNVLEPNVNKKREREITPTSEELASLNLQEGRNTVTFTFSTSVLGKQQVDARIYLWRWDTRIVISDVDGTITKSDVLGQFMPLVGVDWSQTGVAHLFSAIKENGYQLLFLSARAISQAYHTRQFLFNLKQDGKALPDGPVVISPDGLFPSLYREVIRRAPHEFKIACLEGIKALFPPDCNPFYAGFGNRDTDEFSYLKVGIPKGKIFIINPKGEVVVNRRVDAKSYTSLHELVHGMFPSMSSFEQEDFNSWNFWKLPTPHIDI